MIYAAKSHLKDLKATSWLCRWRDADGRRHTRRCDDEAAAQTFLNALRVRRTGEAK